jgi:hypothetical protein
VSKSIQNELETSSVIYDLQVTTDSLLGESFKDGGKKFGGLVVLQDTEISGKHKLECFSMLLNNTS